MDEKIRLINEFHKTKVYKGPKYLYKYRSFDAHAFEMLENNYLYLCKAKDLDDPTECTATIDFNKFYDLETNNLKKECVQLIIEKLRPYTSEENYRMIQSFMESIMNRNGTIRPNFLLDYQSQLQALLPKGYDAAPFINWIVGIPEKLDSPEIKPQIFTLIKAMYNAREGLGICSLSANKSDEAMWKKYALDGTGYCVEYDMTDYEHLNLLFPVIYVSENERKTDITTRILLSFIGNMIEGFSHGNIEADTSQCITLFLTKYDKWKYQNEWRLLGDAGSKLKAPKINAIYLGKRASEANINSMNNISKGKFKMIKD